VNWAALYHHVLPPWCAASPQAQKQQSQSWSETSETVNQNKPFLVKLISLSILSQQWKDNILPEEEIQTH
jgi:hypothetical protein